MIETVLSFLQENVLRDDVGLRRENRRFVSQLASLLAQSGVTGTSTGRKAIIMCRCIPFASSAKHQAFSQ